MVTVEMLDRLLIGAWAGARALRSLLFDVAPSDARIFATAVVVLLACGLVSAWLPARRAVLVDPVVALRGD